MITIINGQKVLDIEKAIRLTTAAFGPHYNRQLCPRHASCSEFILDMKSPGIEIRPIINMVGEHCFNEIFF